MISALYSVLNLASNQLPELLENILRAAIIYHIEGQRSKLGFYVPFNSQGHIGTGPQNCHLWDSNPQR